MPYAPPPDLPRSAVVDLGSNSVRLVVFEGLRRNPLAIFNEKAVLRLGSGLSASGRLDDAAAVRAMEVLHRYHAIARAMGAEAFEVLATAAVRDATNGAEFVAALAARMPGVPIRVLSGADEGKLSAIGVFGGMPHADGVLAGIGGGSLELVRLKSGRLGRNATLKLGVLSLAERSTGDPARARDVTEADLARVPWLAEAGGHDLYLVGGAWRALARMHIAETGYPLGMVHHYAIARDAAREFSAKIAASSRRELERRPAVPRRRIDDLPFAAIVLRRLLRLTDAARIVFSANGLREGWYLSRLPEAVRAEDPLLAAARELARRLGRDPSLPPALLDWTEPLFAGEAAAQRRLREAAVWMSDAGSHDHPEYRAEQAFFRILRQPGAGFDHPERAFLALAVARRYEAPANAPYLNVARALLDTAATARADSLGMALRLAYTLSAGTPDLLAAAALRVGDGRLVLRLTECTGVFSGESVQRRLDQLAAAAQLGGVIEIASARRRPSGG
jgi:exopolyphosphatase / guanosine-5'-triphosphate,3'-diphosphate pyrophosphatase